MRPISDYKIGERITMMYFDEPTEMRVADYSVDAGMVKIEFINANGASWYTAEQIEDHQTRIRNYYDEDILTQLRNAILKNMRTDNDGVKCLYEGGELDDLLLSLVKIVESAASEAWDRSESPWLATQSKETYMKKYD